MGARALVLYFAFSRKTGGMVRTRSAAQVCFEVTEIPRKMLPAMTVILSF
jgi:hypothetical protein